VSKCETREPSILAAKRTSEHEGTLDLKIVEKDWFDKYVTLNRGETRARECVDGCGHFGSQKVFRTARDTRK